MVTHFASGGGSPAATAFIITTPTHTASSGHGTTPNWTLPPTHTRSPWRLRTGTQQLLFASSPREGGTGPKPCIDTAGAARPACTTTACGGAQPRHKDTACRRSPGQREHNEACALPSYSLPYKCCSGNRPAGSWAVLLASRLHTPEARDHHTRATRPASTARVSPAQPWVQAPNTSALARHGDSLCQRRGQSSRHSLHHHDADSHCQFRPRHTSTH